MGFFGHLVVTRSALPEAAFPAEDVEAVPGQWADGVRVTRIFERLGDDWGPFDAFVDRFAGDAAAEACRAWATTSGLEPAPVEVVREALESRGCHCAGARGAHERVHRHRCSAQQRRGPESDPVRGRSGRRRQPRVRRGARRTAGTASAGEVNGNGDPLPSKLNAQSECVYSGLDTKDASDGGTEVQPPMFDDDALAVRGNDSPAGVYRYHGVQNYGIFVRAGAKGAVPSPGVACNPTAS